MPQVSSSVHYMHYLLQFTQELSVVSTVVIDEEAQRGELTCPRSHGW